MLLYEKRLPFIREILVSTKKILVCININKTKSLLIPIKTLLYERDVNSALYALRVDAMHLCKY
jgi:hypothetical protein